MGSKTTINQCLIFWCIIGFITSLFCYIYIATWINQYKNIQSGSFTQNCTVDRYQITQSSGGTYKSGSFYTHTPPECSVTAIIKCSTNNNVKQKLSCGKVPCIDAAISSCILQMPINSTQLRVSFNRTATVCYTQDQYESIGRKYSESPMPSIIALSVMTCLFAVGTIIPCILLKIKKN